MPRVYLLPGLGGWGEHANRFGQAASRFFDVVQADYISGLEEVCASGVDLRKGVARLTAEILETDGAGSIGLIGYSSGGYAALQLAWALNERGCAPAFVALLDSARADPPATERSSSSTGSRLRDALLPLYRPLFRGLLDLGLLDPARLVLLHARRRLGRDRLTGPYFAMLTVLWERAVATFPLESYAGKVVLFHSESVDASWSGEAWKAVCPKLRLIGLRGDHWSMMTDPLVDENAKVVRRALACRRRRQAPARAIAPARA